MSNGLSVADVVNVNVSLSPVAAATRNFGSLLLLGSSPVLSPGEALREYTDMNGVAADFGLTDPEYQAAENYFSQSPQPSSLYIARWAQTASAGVLHGGVLSQAEQNLSNFTGVTNGSLDITIDGTAETLTGINLSGATTLDGVAAAVQNAFSTVSPTVTWNASYHRFEVRSGTTGTTSSVGYATTPASGTDVGALLQLTSANASQPLPGYDAEALDVAVQRVASESTQWYGLAIAATGLTDAGVLAAAQVIEAQSPSRIFGVTTQESTALDPNNTSDLAYNLSNANLARTAVQYSSSDPYAIVSAIGRAFTVNYTGANTVITLKFKQEPGVIAENLNQSQANALEAKNCNVFVKYDNNTQILEQGVMANGDYFDERHGLDWFQNYIQTNLFNLLYQSQTKIPQTDPGVNQLLSNTERSCGQAVRNGLLAPGIWRSSVEFGTLHTGDTLTKGYYAYAPPVATQNSADRAKRIAPTIQVAAKLAGAVHYADVVVNVNR